MFCRSRLRSPLLFAVSMIMVAACGDSATGPGAVFVVIVDPVAATLHPGGTILLTATPLDAHGAQVPNRLIVWTTSDGTVATVNAAGLVSGVGLGPVTITATTDGVPGVAGITVTVTPIATVTITTAQSLIVAGDTLRLRATLKDSAGGTLPGRVIIWTSSDSTRATVNDSGRVTAVDSGPVTITATSEGQADSVDLRVTLVAALRVSPAALTIVQGGTLQLHAIAVKRDSNTIYDFPGVAWTSLDKNVALVSQAGVVSALTPGTTIVSGTVDSTIGQATIGVRTAVFAQVESGDGGQICGASTDSLAYCWGEGGYYFGVGMDAPDSSSSPILVTDTLRFLELHGGEGYSCGIAVGGAAYCWGFAANGRLGNGINGAFFFNPVAVLGGHSFVTMGIGHSIACGIESSGDAWCWGRNSYGELGRDPVLGSGLTPVLLAGGISWRSMAPGTLTTCGIASDSTGYCWGLNDLGQVGTGDTLNTFAPVPVTGGRKFISISSASQHTCGVTDTGAAYCWGYNGTGALGDSTQTGSPVPVLVSGGLTFTQISAGGMHFGADFSCGVATGGAAYCWGDNFYGELGDGTKTSSSTPVAVTGGLTFATVSAGFKDACGLTTSGITYCWGRTFGIVPLRIAGQP